MLDTRENKRKEVIMKRRNRVSSVVFNLVVNLLLIWVFGSCSEAVFNAKTGLGDKKKDPPPVHNDIIKEESTDDLTPETGSQARTILH